ncbi:hypothetical protein NDU88_008049 [Pleurodeles waltl]|uniref:Secreted protein n=1 Tax=Pleurodeles waltl TaxID=8319 RepID=A0AAV7VSI6_PLEWA|nr:hypothetical protein NDU88_008049 [Pleurodeles waltl]
MSQTGVLSRFIVFAGELGGQLGSNRGCACVPGHACTAVPVRRGSFTEVLVCGVGGAAWSSRVGGDAGRQRGFLFFWRCWSVALAEQRGPPAWAETLGGSASGWKHRGRLPMGSASLGATWRLVDGVVVSEGSGRLVDRLFPKVLTLAPVLRGCLVRCWVCSG